MKSTISITLILTILFSCSSKVSREEAIVFKEAIFEIADQKIEPCQTFIDESTILIADLQINKAAKIKAEYMFELLEEAKKTINNSIIRMKEIEEIDDEINYRDNYISYFQSEREFFLAIEDWLKYIHENGNVNIEEESVVFNFVREKLSIMYDRQLKIEEKTRMFDEKYKL